MDTFFTKFPNMVYGDYVCKDITRRVKLSAETRNALSQYYLYEVKNGNRADTIADAYYNDPYVDWMLYITNDIVDPYHQWPLSENEFNATLLKKYGDYAAPFKKIAFYRNNWYDDDNQLSPSYYNNNLPNAYKKYYSPVYGIGTNVIAWKRREEDWTVSTNKIVKLTFSTISTITNITSNGTHLTFTANNNYAAGWSVNVSGVTPYTYNGLYENITSANATHFVVQDPNKEEYISGGTANGFNRYSSGFTEGELVDVKSSGVRVGGGEVSLVTPTYIMIKHVDGEFAVDNIVYGETSKTESTVTAVDTVQENISPDEAVFWSPVYYFDVENEANEYRKQIQILDSAFLFDVSDQVRKKLKE